MATILLTRPMQRAGQLEAVFAAGGHRVYHAPVMRIVPLLIEPLPDSAHFDGLMFTSASAVECLPSALYERFAKRPCLATGPATAQALHAIGFTRVTQFDGDMDALLAELKRYVDRGQNRWLYPCGTTISHTPAHMSAITGAALDALPIYAAEDIGPWEEETLERVRSCAADWTVFLSARTAALFARNCQHDAVWPDGAPGKAACISPAVAQAVAGLGFSAVVVGKEKTTSSLVAAMGLTYC